MATGCLNALRSLVFTLNLLLWLAGLGLIGVALWLRFDPVISNLVLLSESQQNLHLSAYLLGGSGSLMAILGFFGCFGAWRRNQLFLSIFFILLLLVFCMEVTCAIVAYSHQDLIRHYVENSMYNTMQHRYTDESEHQYIFDNIQNTFECCGVKSYRDWLYSKWSRNGDQRAELGMGAGNIGRVPMSCCNREGLAAYPTDCGISFNKMELWTPIAGNPSWEDFLVRMY
uniref:Tetraspanin n=1 Tax=Steinernema glaseri TaxID=37863 RepID=A0A1I7ZJI7_9BILA